MGGQASVLLQQLAWPPPCQCGLRTVVQQRWAGPRKGGCREGQCLDPFSARKGSVGQGPCGICAMPVGKEDGQVRRFGFSLPRPANARFSAQLGRPATLCDIIVDITQATARSRGWIQALLGLPGTTACCLASSVHPSHLGTHGLTNSTVCCSLLCSHFREGTQNCPQGSWNLVYKTATSAEAPKPSALPGCLWSSLCLIMTNAQVLEGGLKDWGENVERTHKWIYLLVTFCFWVRWGLMGVCHRVVPPDCVFWLVVTQSQLQ